MNFCLKPNFINQLVILYLLIISLIDYFKDYYYHLVFKLDYHHFELFHFIKINLVFYLIIMN